MEVIAYHVGLASESELVLASLEKEFAEVMELV